MEFQGHVFFCSQNMKRLLLDSRFATLNQDGSYKFKFDATRISRAKLLYAQIPNVFNTVITNVNNYLDIQIQVSGVTNTYAIQIPAGNYTASTLASYLVTQFTSLAAGGNYSITYDNSKYAFVFTSTYRIRFLFGSGANVSKTCAAVLGFDNLDTTLNFSQTSTLIPDMSSPSYVLVYVNEFDQQLKTNCSLYDNNACYIIPYTGIKSSIQYWFDNTSFTQTVNTRDQLYTELNVLLYVTLTQNVLNNEDVFNPKSQWVLVFEIN